MFLGCCKIRIIFKSFLVPREDIKKMLSCGLPRGISTQAHMMDKVPGMCKAIVDAGLFTFADIDRFPLVAGCSSISHTRCFFNWRVVQCSAHYYNTYGKPCSGCDKFSICVHWFLCTNNGFVCTFAHCGSLFTFNLQCAN